MIWSGPQRAVVLALAIGLLLFFSIRYAFQHTYIDDPQPAEGMRAGELADRLDPNTATVAQIAAIPNVGDKLAEAIVSYRASRVKDFPGRPAFAELKDLLRVKGVGVARMEAMGPYLTFPTPPTRP